MSDRIKTAMDYLGLRREVGDVVDDIPATSRPWLLEQGHIEEVIQSIPAEVPQSPAPETITPDILVAPAMDAPIAPDVPEPPEPVQPIAPPPSDTPIDPQPEPAEEQSDSLEPPQEPEGTPQTEGGN